MDRRKSLKAIALGTVTTSLLFDACKLADKKETAAKTEDAAPSSGNNNGGINRMKEEAAHDKEITATAFFTPDEMATIAVLSEGFKK